METKFKSTKCHQCNILLIINLIIISVSVWIPFLCRKMCIFFTRYTFLLDYYSTRVFQWTMTFGLETDTTNKNRPNSYINCEKISKIFNKKRKQITYTLII